MTLDDIPRWFPLETERLLLREFRPEDFDDIQAYASDHEVSRYMEWGPNTPEITRKVLDDRLMDQTVWPRANVNLGVELKSEERLIGSIRLGVSDLANRTGDFGYAYHRNYWRRGYATEAAHILLGAAFEKLGLHRIYATCDVRNAGSWGVIEKLGMRREATLIEDTLRRDGWRDSHVYAVLEREWAGR
jgi:ribosomal-protein-alanine N-acetyltransferase